MGPLNGLTIIELASIGPSPFACMVLADMGAQVVRVDRAPSAAKDFLSKAMNSDGHVNRGRRSLALNLKDPRAVQIVLRLVEKADVLVEGFRPGVAEALGLGPEACADRNPRLVYARMTGWGQTGPLAKSAGHDLNYIALSGALHAMGGKDAPPPPPLNLVGDYGGGGMLLALGVVAAVFDAQRSGRGQVVDAAMVDGAAQLMAPIYDMMAKGVWRDQRETNMLDGAAPFYACYECADGRFVSIGSIEPQFYRLLLERCGIDDPAFAAQWNVSQWPELKGKLAAIFRKKSRDEWCEALQGSDVCFAPVLSLEEAPHHPHCAERGVFVKMDGSLQPGPAPRFSRTPSEVSHKAPEIGADTPAVLRELGFPDREVQQLLEGGVAFGPISARESEV